MLKKLKKHLTIARRRIAQNHTLKTITPFNNGILQTMVKAILEAQHGLENEKDKMSFSKCEAIRTQMLNDDTIITYEVFNSDKTALVKDICRKAPSSPPWCRLIYNIIKKTESSSVLEIGTNLGISGLYILEAIKEKQERQFITMEGLPQLCALVEKNFKAFDAENKFEIIQGLYNDTFPKLMEKNVSFDIMFIDGNHKLEPTLQYFHELKKKIGTSGIFIFDDINWSVEMQEAWQKIKADPQVNYAIDLYELGIIIIDKKETVKNQNFELHYAY